MARKRRRRRRWAAPARIGGFDDGGGNRGRGGRGGRGNDIAALPDSAALPSDDPEVNRKSLASQMARLVMALLLTTTEPVAWVGVAESPDGKADVLEFKTPDGVATRFLLDAKTHMPLMMTWIGIARSSIIAAAWWRRQLPRRRGADFRSRSRRSRRSEQRTRRRAAGMPRAAGALQMHLSDYKTVNGIKLPHLIQRGANGETTEEFVVKSYRVNPSFQADPFTK